jgi:hypothetical protein
MTRAIDGEAIELSAEARERAANILALVVAAGGRIVCRPHDMVTLTGWELIVREDIATGDKIYEAVRLQQPGI